MAGAQRAEATNAVRCWAIEDHWVRYARDRSVAPLDNLRGGMRVNTEGSNRSSTAFEDIAYLCRLPQTFHEGTESAYDLLHQSRTSPESISIDAVRAVLDADPLLISAWQRWSQDKRTSSGWFLDYENGKHVVGHLLRGNRLTFPDAASACAEFIVRELRDIW